MKVLSITLGPEQATLFIICLAADVVIIIRQTPRVSITDYCF